MAVRYLRRLDEGPLKAIWDGDGYTLVVAGTSGPGIVNTNVTVVRIPSGQSQSAGFNLDGATLYKIVFPSAWTTASLSFLESESESGTYTPVYYGNDEVVLTSAGASRTIRVNPSDFLAVKWMRLRSGVAATPVNQAANRDILVYSYYV